MLADVASGRRDVDSNAADDPTMTTNSAVADDPANPVAGDPTNPVAGDLIMIADFAVDDDHTPIAHPAVAGEPTPIIDPATADDPTLIADLAIARGPTSIANCSMDDITVIGASTIPGDLTDPATADPTMIADPATEPFIGAGTG